MHPSTENANICKVTLPSSIHDALLALDGMPRVKRVEQPATLPSFVLRTECPVAVVREFLGGLFGSDGWAPQLVRHGTKSVEASPYHVRGVKLSHHIVEEHSESLT